MIKCLIVDDEELARVLISSYIHEYDDLTVVGSTNSPTEALEIIKNQEVDLIFLDIQMPEMSGINLASKIDSNTRIIFTTAYSEYALNGFELNAIDYLLKPITEERFEKAIEKVMGFFKIDIQDESITIKSGYDFHKVNLSDIIFIQASSEYVTYQLHDRKILSYQALKTLENSLPQNQFIRVHRSFIINKAYFKSLKGKILATEKYKVPVSSTYLEMVRTLF